MLYPLFLATLSTVIVPCHRFICLSYIRLPDILNAESMKNTDKENRTLIILTQTRNGKYFDELEKLKTGKGGRKKEG